MIDSFDGDYAFLSNFYPSVVHMYGFAYPTVEHAFQAAKSLEHSERMAIREARTPGQAKRLGRLVHLRPGWDSVRLDVMHKLVTRKFSDPKIGALLVATHPHELVEGNNWNDTFWGVCREKGENHLGKILMQVREELLKNDLA